MRLLLLLTTVALLLAACDTAGPPDGPVRLVLPLPALQVESDGPAALVPLRNYFEADPDANPLSFSVETVGDAVSAEVFGDTLAVRPIQEGTAEVRVTATGAQGGEARGALTVTVWQPPCPRGPDTSQADFLPLAAGDTWVFAYRYHRAGGGGSYTRQGTLSLTLTDVVCGEGQRTATAEERLVGHTWGMSIYGTATDTTAFDERRSVSVVETVAGVRLPWTIGGVRRYHAASQDTVRANLMMGGMCTQAAQATAVLVPGGLAELRSSCGGSSGFSNFSLLRLWPGT
ncbi:hypothetical protein BH23BAC4_BH23BAC4_06470 [soil metagenome]